MVDTADASVPRLVPPAGLGLWVAFEKAIDPGEKRRDLGVAIDRCIRAGARWIAPRAGAGGANDAAFDAESLAAYLAAGLRVYPWIFAYQRTQAAEIAGYRRWFELGAHGALINAEFEYVPASGTDARALVAGVRRTWHEAQGVRRMRGLDVVADEAFVAHAPPDYLGAGIGHALSDELVALDEVCDAIMPQIYAWEHDDRGHAFHVSRVMAGYAKRGLGPDRVWPVGCTYRPPRRGGNPIPFMADAAQRVGDDVAAFLDHPIVSACPAPSLYSLDAISWINGLSDTVMRTLAARALADTEPPPDTLPQTPTSRSSQRLAAVREPLGTFDGRAGIIVPEGEHTPIHLREDEDPDA